MNYTIKTSDKWLTKQTLINFRIKIEVLDMDYRIINTIVGGLVNGSISVNPDSGVRRTATLTIIPNLQQALSVGDDKIIWIDKRIKIYIGIMDNRTNEYTWWSQGVYSFMNTSATYDATTNQLSLSCSDRMAELDGSKNGQTPYITFRIPAYEEDDEGKPIKYNVIREALLTVVRDPGGVPEEMIEIDNIGTAKSFQTYNTDFEAYRQSTAIYDENDKIIGYEWNSIPYDLEFGVGSTVYSITDEIVNLYPQFEQYFDIEGNYCCHMIPMCENDPISLDNDYLQEILISESKSVDLSTVRNVFIVYGDSIEDDWFTETCTLDSSTYNATVENFYTEEYNNAENIAIRIPATNPENAKLNINGLGVMDIYDENTEEYLQSGLLEENNVYVFKVKKKYIDHQITWRAYWLGMYQPSACYVLTDGTKSDEDFITQDGDVVKKYSPEYFKAIYPVETVGYMVIPDSPFTIQKQGILLGVGSSSEFKGITSNSLALERARWELYKKSVLTDTITIQTKILPWIDSNWKVEYRPADSMEVFPYITKNISHSWDVSGNASTSITLTRFYDYFIPEGYGETNWRITTDIC